jgi:hypothetical protein
MPPTQRVPATQSSNPPLSAHLPPLATVPSGTQLDDSPSSSPGAHFSPGPQPSWANGSQPEAATQTPNPPSPTASQVRQPEHESGRVASQAGSQMPPTQRVPATQSSNPPLSTHLPPLATVPSGTQLGDLPSSPPGAHFSPGPQPSWASGSQVPSTRSAAAAVADGASQRIAARARQFVLRTPPRGAGMETPLPGVARIAAGWRQAPARRSWSQPRR